MLSLNFQIQHHLMIIALPPRPLQPLHLILLQSPPHRLLKLAPTDLLPRLLLLGRLNARLEPCLHPDPQRRIERDIRRVTAHLGRGVRF